MSHRLSRRQFLRRSAAGAGIVFLANARSATTYAANQKVNLALIGVSGRGQWFVDVMPKMANVVAMCDVNRYRAQPVFDKFPQVKTFADYRKMFDALGNQIDAVTIAIPDHSHAPAAMAALKHGKHVYCEKPLTNTLHEARALRTAARQLKRATQMGNQGTASEAYRRATELVQAGVLGDIKEVYAWTDSGGGGPRELPKETPPVPDTLDWDLWLGPAAYRPYHPLWLQWGAWRDFGTSQLGNWGCHILNLAFRSLKLDTLWAAPAEGAARDATAPAPGGAATTASPLIVVDAQVSEVTRTRFPRWEMIRYDVPPRGALPAVTFHWLNGPGPGARKRIEDALGRPLDWGDTGEKKWKDWAGLLLVGSKGKLYANGHNTEFTLLPAEQFKDFTGPAKSLPRSRGHEMEWLDACTGGPPAWSNFDFADPLAEFALLGNVATQFPGKLEFDPVAQKIGNHAEADKALRREYRQGWSL